MGRHSCGVIALPAAVQPRAGWGRRPLAAQVPPRVRSRRRRRLGRGPRASAGGRDPGRDGSAGRSEVRAPNSPPVPSGPPAPSQAARRAREGTALLCGAGPPEPGRPAATLAVTPSPGGREETARPCAVRLARPRPPSNSPPRAGPRAAAVPDLCAVVAAAAGCQSQTPGCTATSRVDAPWRPPFWSFSARPLPEALSVPRRQVAVTGLGA